MSCANGTTYAYDGDGLRVKKSSGTLYWAGGVAESDASGNLTSEYVFFGGKRVARRDVSTGTVYYYLSDHLGSSNIVASATGAIVNESDFYPFGGERQITNNLANQKYKFTDAERDAESGLDVHDFRSLNTSMGRWMSPDPSGIGFANPTNPQTFNLYAYVGNNPLRYVDPLGLEEEAPAPEEGGLDGGIGQVVPQCEGSGCPGIQTLPSPPIPADHGGAWQNNSGIGPMGGGLGHLVGQQGNDNAKGILSWIEPKINQVKDIYEKIRAALAIAKQIRDNAYWIKAANIDNTRRWTQIDPGKYDLDLINARYDMEFALSGQGLIGLGRDIYNKALTAGVPENVFGRIINFIKENGIDLALDLYQKSVDDGVNKVTERYMQELSRHIYQYGDDGDPPIVKY
jgi:RHS repeat-associated protein